MPWWFNYPGLLLNAEVEYPCLSGERRHLPCINFKDSARPAELPRWLSWYSICLERRTSRVRVPPEAALLFLWKKELSSGVIACICLVSIADYSCTYRAVKVLSFVTLQTTPPAGWRCFWKARGSGCVCIFPRVQSTSPSCARSTAHGP